jgi:hypothetical protein
LSYLYDGVSNEQHHQAQMYMYLTGYNRWVVAAYLVETQFMSDNGLTYPIPHDQRTILVEVLRDYTWAERLDAIIPKIIEKRDSYVEILKLKFNRP